jgi:hypothetical protein
VLNGKVNGSQVLVRTFTDGPWSTVPVALYVKMRLHSDWLYTGLLKDPSSNLVNISNMAYQNISKYLPNDTASHPR